MYKMDDIEFEELTKDISENVKIECVHRNVVRLYTFGTHTDYGCLDCGLQHTNRDVFNSKGITGWR